MARPIPEAAPVTRMVCVRFCEMAKAAINIEVSTDMPMSRL